MNTTTSTTNEEHMKRLYVKWNNGYWKLFDLTNYEDIDIFDLRKDAFDAMRHLNRKQKEQN
jgi:hypothetical protein